MFEVVHPDGALVVSGEQELAVGRGSDVDVQFVRVTPL